MIFEETCFLSAGFPAGSVVKTPSANAEDMGSILNWEDPLEKELATDSSFMSWEIPWTEEQDGLQSHRIAKKSDTT